MQAPVWVLRSVRTGASAGLVLSTAVSTAVFVATPISLASIADRFDVGRGTAGIFSAAQLGMFVLASWAAGRFMTPSRRGFRLALFALAAANLASVVVADFLAFVTVRGLSGVSLGVLTWLAWSQVFGDEERQGDIAVVGPVTGVVASPLFGLLLEAGDDRWVFGALGFAAVVPIFFSPEFATAPQAERTARTRAVPQAIVLIVALTLLTLGGSAVFVFSGVIMIDQAGISPGLVSLVFAANALASIPSARWRGPRPRAGLWLLLTASCAVALGQLGPAWMAWVALTVWGFAFWAGVPGVYTLLSQRSARPAERAGDAQAAMAAGRAVGPLVGGAVVSAWSFGVLGLVGGALMATGGVLSLAVERRGAAK